MKFINGIPIIWDEEADKKLLGNLFLSGVQAPQLNSISVNPANSQNNIPQYDSPFGDDSIFSNSQDIEYVVFVNFKKLISDIKNNQGKIMPYKYNWYESHSTLQPLLIRGPFNKIIEKAITEDEVEDDPLIKKTKELIRKMLPTPPRKRVDDEYKDNSGKYVYLDGRLNIKEGFIKIAKESIGFVFELNATKRIIKFTDYFHYVDENSGLPKAQWAIGIEATQYENYLGLSNAEGLKLSDSSKKNIIARFTGELGNSKAPPQTIAWLYYVMPDFVFLQRDKNLLIKDLAAILQGKVNEDGINEEVIVLKILQAFITDKPVDQDNLLTQLTTTFTGKQTLFEVLYNKMNDWGGDDNWTAAILMLYKIWSVSKFADDNNYSYAGQPETLAYESKKILGFYDSGFDFSFKNNKIEVQREREAYMGEGAFGKEMAHFAGYYILQPIQLQEFDQRGELKILDRIPAFYLKAFNDKNAWANFEKTAWVIVDVITTFTAVGNLLKLRYLRYISKGVYYLRVATGTVQLASGIAGLMLDFVDDCKEETFCSKLRTYLFWLDLATISLDSIVEKMWRKSAKEVLDNMPSNLRKQYPEVEAHLDEVSVSGRGRRLGQRLVKRDFAKIEEFLKNIKCDFEVFPQTGSHEIAGFFSGAGRKSIFEDGASAIFITDGKSMKLCLREEATYFEFFHELMHLRHSKELGLNNYYKLGGKGTPGEILKEQYVFDKILVNTEILTRSELKDALNYINDTRSLWGQNPIQFSLDINSIPEIRKEIIIDNILKKK